ncbi:MAG: TonB-dependent receptor [Ferruginibacter sp.]
MKFNHSLFALLFICLSSSAQKITGIVKSASGHRIAFVSISVLNTLKNTATDENGKFSLDLQNGQYTISISATGFITAEKNITVKDDITITEVVLKENTDLLKEVVVTGTKTDVSKNYVPFNISVVNRQQIEKSSESALLPVLSQQVPGLFVTQRGVTGFGVSAGAAGTISMRGLSGSPNNRVLVLINGNPQFMGIFGHPLPDAYVASDVQKVEVLHGAGSVLYGTNAMGGVINIITRSQQQDGYSVNGRVLYGSFNTQKYLLNTGYKKKRFNIMASFNHDQTDGHRPNSAFNINNGFVKLGYQLSDHFSAGAEYNIAKYTATDPGPLTGQKGLDIDILRGSAYAYVANKYKNSSGNIQFFYNYGKHKLSDGFRSSDANYGVSIYQSFNTFKNNTSTIGFDYKKYGGKAENIFAMNGQGIVFGDRRIEEWAPYIFSQQTIGKLVVSAGFRLENNSVYGNVAVPSGGVSYIASANTTVKAAVSKGFRSPTMLELYLFPPANAALKAEKMMNYEASFRHLLLNRKIALEFTIFNVQGDNLIQTVFQNGGPKNVNTGAFNNTGLEFAGSYSASEKFRLGINYAYTHLKNPVLAAPKSQLAINGDYRIKKFTFNVILQHISGLYTQVTPALTSNYFLINAKAGYAVNSFIDVFVKGENLTDQSYQINYGYPMPGATILGGVNFRLAKLY